MKEVGRAGAYYFSASGTLNYALCRRGAGICPGITGGKKKKKIHEPVWTHDSNTRQERNDVPTYNPVQQQCSSSTAVQQYLVQQ